MYAPAAKIEGTQIPTYKPSSLYPENHSPTETKKEIKTAVKRKKSDFLYLLNIL